MIEDLATKFATSLDKCEFENALGFLDENCIYILEKKVIQGAESIVESYSENYHQGRRKVDTLIFESTVEVLSTDQARVTFTDNLVKKGKAHRYRCFQDLTFKEDLIVKIEHGEFPGQKEALDQFLEDQA